MEVRKLQAGILKTAVLTGPLILGAPLLAYREPALSTKGAR
jgi:hypothetical protein